VPCFNEAASIPLLLQELEETVRQIKTEIQTPLSLGFILIDDGSTDSTVKAALQELAKTRCFDRKVIVRLSRNFGKEAALLAGLRCCDADSCIILDADLQDPPTLMIRMIRYWLSGKKVVNAVREDRSEDGLMKRLSAMGFYWLFDRFSHLKIQLNSSDFRLLDRLAMDAILSCQESIRFSKGFFAWIGFEQANVFFKRPKRQQGKSKWGSWKLWNYALDGIFSFSTAPLRIWSYVGIIMTAVSFLLGTAAILRILLHGIDVPGYASLFVAVTFLGGLQLMGIGIIGEYLGRVYIETKRRPSYVIREIKHVQ
jgi:glycosyltransferase involved in cell wall biosynthesis